MFVIFFDVDWCCGVGFGMFFCTFGLEIVLVILIVGVLFFDFWHYFVVLVGG